MRNDQNIDRLLDDLTDEALTPGFRKVLLESSLGELRNRRRLRRSRRAAISVVLLLGAFLALWQAIRPPVRNPSLAAYGLIRSQPLGADQNVETQVGATTITATSGGLLAQIATAESTQGYRRFSDSELLEFLSDKPVVLVSLAPNQAELVFLNPEDAAGFSLP